MAESTKAFMEVWSNLSRKVLAPVLVDDGAVFPVHEEIGSHIEWFSPKERPIYQAVLECMDDNTPPHP